MERSGARKNSGNQLTDKNLNAEAAQDVKDNASKSGLCRPSLTEIQLFAGQYRGLPLKQLRLGEMLSDLVSIPRQHHIALPADLSLLVKAFITLEGLGRELDPEFDMTSETLPLLER